MRPLKIEVNSIDNKLGSPSKKLWKIQKDEISDEESDDSDEDDKAF
jgi:hypothetical protein